MGRGNRLSTAKSFAQHLRARNGGGIWTIRKEESARQCPNLDGALPTNVLANTFQLYAAILRYKKIRLRNSQPEYRTTESPANPFRASAGALPVRSFSYREGVSDLRPLPAGAKFRPISLSRAQSSLLELPRREMEEQSSTATAGLLTRSVCDAFPTQKSVARECRIRSLRLGGAGTYSSGNCSGFAPDSHLIPSAGTLRRTSENRCRAKVAIFSKRPLPSAVFLKRQRKRRLPQTGQPPISGTHPAAPPVVTRYFTNSSGIATGLPVRRTVGIGAFHPRSLLPSSAASSFTFAGCSAARLCCSPMSSARL